jgi:2-polyprenyl-6-hydroxyphenyl methylase/3-demethylubiquinone-9 3-methyltransferase
MTADNDLKFGFGENWETFIQEYLSEERVEDAKESLTDFYDIDSFEGRSFVDVGCGSGLFSYAAYKLGAEEVLSFDVDTDSVRATRKLYHQIGSPDNWTVEEGNILDDDYVSTLGTFDLVYSWGVLHHTGAMYESIDAALSLAAENAQAYFAIYNRHQRRPLRSVDWREIKRFYNQHGKAIRLALLGLYVVYWSAYQLKQGNNPISEAKRYGEGARGMAFLPDAVDWLGGYPYEYATVEEITDYIESNTTFSVQKVNEHGGLACNEYLLTR